MREFKYIDNKQVEIFKSSWSSRYVCYDCKHIFNDFGSYITCSKCGSQSGDFKSIRNIYIRKFWFFRELIEREIK